MRKSLGSTAPTCMNGSAAVMFEKPRPPAQVTSIALSIAAGATLDGFAVRVKHVCRYALP